MRTAFMQIFWGFVVIAVDLTITEVDLLLPDIIGYMLIFMAATTLSGANVQFSKARPFAAVGAAIWVMSLFHLLPPLTQVGSIVVDLVLSWYVCTGILQLAVDRSNLNLAQSATTTRSWVLGVSLVNLLGATIALPFTSAAVLVVPLAIVSLIIGVVLLMLIRRAAFEIA